MREASTAGTTSTTTDQPQAARGLAAGLALRYPREQYPALLAQTQTWVQQRPLAGVSVLDATPVFTNTTAKHVALLVAGARLTVSAPPELPADPAVVTLLAEAGVAVIAGPADPGAGPYDVVLDCAGLHASLPSRCGYAELTRSGVTAYQSCRQPVLSIDHTPIKAIETSLGTGESFLRALAALGRPMPPGVTVVIFGAGKVGTGVARTVARAGGQVILVDQSAEAGPQGLPLLTRSEPDEVIAAIQGAWCVVTATGVEGAAADFAAPLRDSGALLANMGVTDEFGPEVPAGRVLNAKTPVKFVLAEPTLMPYMDPVMALHNWAAVELVAGNLQPGLQQPDARAQDQIMAAVLAGGSLAAEIAGWWPPVR